MIIDFHVHIFPSLDIWPPLKTEAIFEMKRRTVGEAGLEKYKRDIDGTAESLIRDMDEAGVDKSVVSAVDFGYYLHQDPKISIWRLNEYIAESQAKYPDRIIGFAGVDPRRRDAIELIEKAIKEWGLKGVKLLTTHYYVTAPEVQPFFSKLNDLEVPVLIHQGSDSPPHLIEYSNPKDLEVLLLRYPKMTIIACHFARGYERILEEIMQYNVGRIYGDLTGLQYEYWKSPWSFIMRLRYWMDKFPQGVVLGSEWPFIKTPPLPTHKEWVDVIRNLKIPKQVIELGLGIRDFSQEEKDMILGENARTILKI